MKKHVVPFLVPIERDWKEDMADSKSENEDERILEGYSSYKWPLSVKSFFRELVGPAEDNGSD